MGYRYLVKFAENSSIGGLVHIAGSKTWAGRIYWILVMATSWILHIYLTSETFIEWDQNPVSTLTETGTTSDVEFPKIVVCPPRVNIQLHFSC